MIKPLVVLAYPKIDHEKDYVYYWMPFSLLSIAKVLIDDDVADVVLFDGNQSDEAAWHRLLDAHADRAVCIGISVMTGGGQIAHALKMAAAAKERENCPMLVFGGPHVNVLPDQTLAHPLVDCVLVGPGQTSMPALVEALLGRRSLSEVPGLISKGLSGVIRGPANPARTRDLGGYPWQLLDVQKYVRDDPTVSPRTLNYVSSQGCVYKCRFCYELTYKRKYSRIPVDALIADVTDLVKRFNVGGVKFYDADWFIDLHRAAGFARALIDQKLGIRWAASINPNDIIKARRLEPDLLPLIRDSGCSRLLMGVESGSDRVLRDVVEKEITREQILEVAAQIADHGILGSYTFIVGFPGETAAEQAETYDLIEQLWKLTPTPETRVHVFAPYPGTPLFETALAQGFKAPERFEEWASYDYYESQTPWTDAETVRKARFHTRMVLAPKTVAA
ncbi:B12-binding domain-containing radical SAM protein [Brevundimonas sp.]|uniref:B12-binding domain-containing radical SAM protein n=1 Tax=Brevundimonas sp. TaxID=1871086 RepID=UPI003F6E742A